MNQIEGKIGIPEAEKQINQADWETPGEDNSPDNGIVLNQDFLDKYPEIDRKSLSAEILFGKYDIRRFPYNSTNGIGTTGHKGRPASLIIPTHQDGNETSIRKIIRVDVFTKPHIKVADAKNEYSNSREILGRGISTPLMVGYIKFADGAIILSEFDHSAVPLSLQRIDWQLRDPRVYSKREFLMEYLRFIANGHNEGVVFGDLHLGNIGSQIRADGPSNPIAFDLETANVLERSAIGRKKKNRYRSASEAEKFKMFEGFAVQDLAAFVSFLVNQGNFPLIESGLEGEPLKIYKTFRRRSFGVMGNRDLKKTYEDEYNRIAKSLKNPSQAA